jgi:N-acetylglucosamine-6-phosphate deacetylase
MGIDHDWGGLAVGRIANITVLSPTAEVIQTFLSGHAMTA